LVALKGDGHRLGLVTSKMEEFARRGLRLVGLESMLEVAVFHDDTTRHKPDPEPLLMAASRARVPASSVIYVGDSTHDIVAGRAAGMRTVAVLWGPFEADVLAAAGPDFTVATPADLPRLIGTLDSGEEAGARRG